MSVFGHPRNESYRVQLEQDVHDLEKLLSGKMELRIVLENAIDYAGTLEDLSHLPPDASELLSSIATLEFSILRLEEEMVSLHYQLIQERNERRIAEYRLKQFPSNPFFSSLQDVRMLETTGGDKTHETCKNQTILPGVFQNLAERKLKKTIPVKNLWNYPNRLSEEMVRCMKNIFISLAESSGCTLSTASTYGHLSSSSLWSLSESPSAFASWLWSPQVDIQCNNDLLATESSFDPYKAQGKLSWADIGNYCFAIEVSWMSVGKKQLEYASDALRRFRCLIEQLAKVNPLLLSADEKLAFWINLYNALMLHAYLAYGVPRSEYKLFSLMQKATYTVGGHSMSAAAIEYVILKMKLPSHRPQTTLLLALQKLKVSEEQIKFSIRTPEPLLAFALSSGMYSSPAVRIYTAGNVREELEEAQRDYIRASVGVSNKGKLLIPKMLHGFARSCVDESKIATWVSGFLSSKQSNFVEQCMSQRKQTFLGSSSCEFYQCRSDTLQCRSNFCLSCPCLNDEVARRKQDDDMEEEQQERKDRDDIGQGELYSPDHGIRITPVKGGGDKHDGSQETEANGCEQEKIEPMNNTEASGTNAQSRL